MLYLALIFPKKPLDSKFLIQGNFHVLQNDSYEVILDDAIENDTFFPANPELSSQTI